MANVSEIRECYVGVIHYETGYVRESRRFAQYVEAYNATRDEVLKNPKHLPMVEYFDIERRYEVLYGEVIPC